MKKQDSIGREYPWISTYKFPILLQVKFPPTALVSTAFELELELAHGLERPPLDISY